jgi:hypothetical protein
MESFFIDESGYTGFDLLNADQCFQGASAVAISDDDAARLIREFFPRLQAPELKYHSLALRPRYRRPLMELQRVVLSDYKCVTSVCDKRYVLILMFLDIAVEPFYYRRGINFFEDGHNYSLASLLYIAGPTLFGEKAFDNLLMSFQQAVRQKTPQTLETLIQAVEHINWRKLPEAFEPLAYRSPECLSEITLPSTSTDAAIIVLQSLINRMEEMTIGSYQVIHDQSKNLLTYHDLLQSYIDHTDEVEFIQSKITSIRFPLKLNSVTQVNSKHSPTVQIADVMIGAMIEAYNGLTGKREPLLDPEEVRSQYAEGQIIDQLPSIDFEAQKQFHKGTQAYETIDYFAKHFGQ